MVRLLQLSSPKTRQLNERFQSHNGAIAAQLLLRLERWQQRCFNPTMVRLLLGNYCCHAE